MSLITEQQAAALARGLLLEYLDQCTAARLHLGTAASLLGVSRTRVGSIKKALAEARPLGVSLEVFLRAKQLLDKFPAAREAGVLPATAQRGAAQDAVLEWFGIDLDTVN